MHRYTAVEDIPTKYLNMPRMSTQHQILSRILDMDQGETITITGPKGSGKRSFLKKLLEDNKIEAFFIDGSEISTDGRLDLNKFTKAIRSTVSIEIKENLKIVEGEVTLITYDRLQLKTRDMESVFNIGIRMRRELERERVCVGDIIRIYKESCFITRLGRSSDKALSTRSDSLPRIPLPEGECIKTDNIVSILTLDEFDAINSGENNLYTDGLASKYIRDDVDRKIQILLKENKAILKRRALVIYGCEEQDVELFERILSPAVFNPSIFLIFDTPVNDDESSIRIQGVLDYLKGRIMCFNFQRYNKEEIEEIILYFCSECNLELNKSSIDLFVRIAQERGLDYAKDMMKASIKEKNINENDIVRLVNLFD